MPHLILEASANIHESTVRLKQLLIECQNVLVNELPTQISSCKSRVILHDIYVIGDNSPNNAFVHLTVKLLKGRASELLTNVANMLRDVILKHCVRSNDEQNLGVSVEIIELSDIYAKK